MEQILFLAARRKLGESNPGAAVSAQSIFRKLTLGPEIVQHTGLSASEPANIQFLAHVPAWRDGLRRCSSGSSCRPWAHGPSSENSMQVPSHNYTLHSISSSMAARALHQQQHKRLASKLTASAAASLSSKQSSAQRRLRDQALYLVALVVGMVGMTYASVPLYRMFCQATGFGGTVQQGNTVEAKLKAREAARNEALEAAAATREVTVSFNANVADGLPWRFSPTQRAVTIHPGQSTLAFYTAHNLGDRDITGVSTYNVAPQQAGAYFNKIQCFCFEEQRLRAGEKVDMPVFFYLDPEFATDPRMRSISHLTLSYTFFKVDDEDYDAEELQEQLNNRGKAFHGLAAAQ